MSVKHGVPDLLYVFKVAEFMYTLYSIPDNLYGVYDHETKEWNGIVRELIDRKADISVASMTINFARLLKNVLIFRFTD